MGVERQPHRNLLCLKIQRPRLTLFQPQRCPLRSHITSVPGSMIQTDNHPQVGELAASPVPDAADATKSPDKVQGKNMMRIVISIFSSFLIISGMLAYSHPSLLISMRVERLLLRSRPWLPKHLLHRPIPINHPSDLQILLHDMFRQPNRYRKLPRHTCTGSNRYSNPNCLINHHSNQNPDANPHTYPHPDAFSQPAHRGVP